MGDERPVAVSFPSLKDPSSIADNAHIARIDCECVTTTQMQDTYDAAIEKTHARVDAGARVERAVTTNLFRPLQLREPRHTTFVITARNSVITNVRLSPFFQFFSYKVFIPCALDGLTEAKLDMSL